MPEDEKTSAEYLSGFNQGYELAQKLPDLAEKLFTAVGEDDRGQGFKDGCEQMNLERIQDRIQDKTPRVDDQPNTELKSDRGIEPGA